MAEQGRGTAAGDETAQDDPGMRFSRRSLIGAGVGLALGSWLPAGVAGAAAPAGEARRTPSRRPTRSSGWPKATRVMRRTSRAETDFSSGRAARATAQYPIAAILSCADWRVAPELVFDQGPGDLFVVRVAGNSVNTDILASLEYGVEFLGIPLIVVLGHSGCGAVDAAIKVLKKDAKLPGHLPGLVGALKPAVVIAEKAKSGSLLDNAIAVNVRRSVAALEQPAADPGARLRGEEDRRRRRRLRSRDRTRGDGLTRRSVLVEDLGDSAIVDVEVAGRIVKLRAASTAGVTEGANVHLAFDPGAVHLFDAANGVRRQRPAT